MFAALEEHETGNLVAAGHRIVHGGPFCYDPQRVDAQLKNRLKVLVAFALLHLPSQIAMIEEVWKRRTALAQVVCFDTAFHRRMPEVARRFALPRNLWDQGVARYGFHGLSYEFVVGKLGKELGRRAIMTHLGNDARMVAVHAGTQVEPHLALTPT